MSNNEIVTIFSDPIKATNASMQIANNYKNYNRYKVVDKHIKMNILLIEITHITYHFRFTNEYYSITCRTISSDAYYGALLIVEQGAQRLKNFVDLCAEGLQATA